MRHEGKEWWAQLLCNCALGRASKPGNPLLDHVQINQPACGLLPHQTALYDLDAQLVVKVAHTQHLSPKALAGDQRINTNGVAHFLELCSQKGILLDVFLVQSGKLLEAALKDLKLKF